MNTGHNAAVCRPKAGMEEVMCSDPSWSAMRHQLIMISGASPGAGKSTLAALLSDALTQQDIPNRRLSEHDLLERELFARFDQELGNNALHAIDSPLLWRTSSRCHFSTV